MQEKFENDRYVVHNIVIFLCLILSFWSLDIVLIDHLIVYDLSILQISHLLLFLVLFENSSERNSEIVARSGEQPNGFEQKPILTWLGKS